VKIITTTAALRSELAAARERGRAIGFVPTMGALHDGHLSLLRRARADNDVVILSIFVNPMQFNEPNDLLRYPRDLDRDTMLAEAEGTDLIFAPEVSDIYPDGYATVVGIPAQSAILEGAIRGASHFDGVLTVVAKLFNIVQPTVAYFGQKDAQQVFLVQRMVRDLAFPLRIDVCSTVREADGLAMSSRNVRLNDRDRRESIALSAALHDAKRAIENGDRDVSTLKQRAVHDLEKTGIATEYFEVVSAQSFEPLALASGRVIILVAARVGPVRLIDNVVVDVPTLDGRGASGAPGDMHEI
jgi:pantoate--beta-alanine ligase